MKTTFFSAALIFAAFGAHAQCVADFDFGDADFGASPDASLGEQFDTAYVDVAYEDVFHVLVPIDASAIDPAFQLPIDSIILETATLVADSGAGAVMSFADVGLDIVCNNGGVSPNACTFLGGGQYCADLIGTPTLAGVYTMSLQVQAWVTVFGVAIPQPYVFDGYVLTIIGETSSIQEQSEVSFTLFPNPATEIVNFQLPQGLNRGTIQVRDISGRLIHESRVQASGVKPLNVSRYMQGIYFITLTTDDAQWTERMVVSH